MPDMHAPDAAPDIPDISEALDVRPMPHTQALALKRRVAESAMCAILKSKKWVREVRKLGDSTAPIRAERLPRGTTVVGYVVTKVPVEQIDLAASAAARERRELVEQVTWDGKEARNQWHLKHVKKR